MKKNIIENRHARFAGGRKNIQTELVADAGVGGVLNRQQPFV